MDIWILKLGMWMSRSLVRLPTFGDKVSVLVFRNIDRHTVTSCRRCACIERAVCEKKKKKEKKRVNSRLLFLIVALHIPQIYQVVNLTDS